MRQRGRSKREEPSEDVPSFDHKKASRFIKSESISVQVEAKTRGQTGYIQDIVKNDIILCQGPAGCGKTIIAIGMALQDHYSKNRQYEKIIVMRPIKEACDEHVGYLPGDLDDKMAPWAAPILDNLMVFINGRIARELFRDQDIEVIPLAYARGRSLNNSFIILDEAQNCTPKQMLMALTRIGEGSKMVINGDISQNDASTTITGLEDAMQRLEGMPRVAVRTLYESDIVRNKMIGEIIERYKTLR